MLQDIEVVVLDINQQRIDAWNSAKLPIFEPGRFLRAMHGSTTLSSLSENGQDDFIERLESPNPQL